MAAHRFTRVVTSVVLLSLLLAACEGEAADPSPVVTASSAPSTPAIAAPPSAPVTVEVLATIPVGSNPGNMAVDSAGGAVYVTNDGDGAADGTVSVIDTATRKVVETISLGAEPAGLTLDQGAGLLYVTESNSEGVGSISVIDTATRRVIDTITIGAWKWPGDVAVDLPTQSLYVVNNGDATVSIVDTKARHVVQTLQVDGSPHGLAASSQAAAVYLSGDDQSLSVIDMETRRIAEKSVEGLHQGPLAVDDAAGVLLLGNEAYGSVSVFDTATHELRGTVTAGGPYGPADVAVDPTAGRAYVTGGSVDNADEHRLDWLVAVIDTATLEVVESITWEPQAENPSFHLVVDPATDSVYLTGDGIVTVIARR